MSTSKDARDVCFCSSLTKVIVRHLRIGVKCRTEKFLSSIFKVLDDKKNIQIF